MKVPLPTQEQQRERQGTLESCRTCSGTAVGAGGDLPLSSDTMLGSWGL